MISFYSPQINSPTFPVTFSFTNVNIKKLNPKTYADLRFKAVEVYDKDGNLFNKYVTLTQASRSLGLTSGKIKYHYNRVNHSLAECFVQRLKKICVLR